MKKDLLESEEEGAGPDDEEQGQVEDSFLSGHHHPPVAAESVFTRELLPFSHLSRYHHGRHGARSVLGASLGQSQMFKTTLTTNRRDKCCPVNVTQSFGKKQTTYSDILKISAHVDGRGSFLSRL